MKKAGNKFNVSWMLLDAVLAAKKDPDEYPQAVDYETVAADETQHPAVRFAAKHEALRMTCSGYAVAKEFGDAAALASATPEELGAYAELEAEDAKWLRWITVDEGGDYALKTETPDEVRADFKALEDSGIGLGVISEYAGPENVYMKKNERLQ